MYFIQHCFICRPLDSTVSEDAGIEPRTVATSALAVRRSSHSAHLTSTLNFSSVEIFSPAGDFPVETGLKILMGVGSTRGVTEWGVARWLLQPLRLAVTLSAKFLCQPALKNPFSILPLYVLPNPKSGLYILHSIMSKAKTIQSFCFLKIIICQNNLRHLCAYF